MLAKSNMFKTKQKWYVLMMMLFLKLNMVNYKNIGMNRFTKQFNKVLRTK